MSRHGWLAALALTACGCLSAPSRFHAERDNVKGLTDLPPLPAATAAPTPEATRAQMPDDRSPNQPGNEKGAVCRLITLPVEPPAEAARVNPATTIRAVVNGDLILQEEVILGCGSQIHNPHLTRAERDEMLKKSLENLIDREILLQDAIAKLKRGGKQGDALLKKIQESADEAFDKSVVRALLKERHLNSRSELTDLMKRQGVSLEVMRRWWERNWMAQQYLFARLERQMNNIGHTEVTGYYNDHRDEYMQPDSVDWQDIFIDANRHASPAAAREFAESLMQRVKQGEDFVKLSHEFDNGESGRFRKGAGQGHKRGDIFPPEAEPLLFRMHDGDTNVVECAHGYHVIRLVKRQYAGPIPFDAKVQKEIHDKLRDMAYKREKDSIVKDLKRKAVIDRCD